MFGGRIGEAPLDFPCFSVLNWPMCAWALQTRVQGTLGGMTVLLRLPLVVSVTHACLAQAFLCLVITLAVCTAPGWQAPQTPPRHPCHQWELKLTGSSREKSPLGSARFSL